MPLNLDKHKLTQTFTNYIAYCKRSPWLTVREAYKFKFGRWLYSRVDFDKQTDEEILQICLDSQEKHYDNEDNEKGINFITQALRFNDTVISIDDIKLIRSLRNGETLQDKALKDSPLSYPKFSCWVGTLLPETYKIYGTDLIGVINYLYNTADIPTRGANSYRLVNEYLNDLAVHLKTDFDKEIQELINLIFPEFETLVPCDLVWLLHDYIMFLDRRVFNYQPSYFWVNQGREAQDEIQHQCVKASLQNIHHHKRLKELKEGDILIHYFDKSIQAISQVTQEYIIEYDVNGNGFLLVRVLYNQEPSIPFPDIKKLFKRNYQILPKKNSPFDKNFNVNQGYCFDFNKASFELIFGETPTQNTHNTMEKIVQPLNQILYGPPGTGKTYVTRQMAVAIANPVFNFSDDTELKEEYNRLVKEGQIKFTTFHQSMGYEDFVEGIKPVLLEEANEESATANATISYKVEAGIFKELAEIAKGVSGSKNTSQAINVEEVRYFKMSLGGKQRPKTHNWCIENNVVGLGWGGKHNFTSLASCTSWDEFKVEFAEQFPELKEESSYIPQAIRILQKMSIGDIVIVSKGNHIIDAVGVVEGGYEYDENNPHGIYHQRKVKWIATNMDASPSLFVDKNISQQSIYEFYSVDIKTDEIAKLIAPETETNATKNYVLIIDEINRGNVSAIFGELITLLEDTKRLGSKEELKVTLPYSKTEFGVPANVYIIGTMNTADRSVEALDTALRRRFSFTEMMPDVTLLSAIQFGDFSLAEILETINQRVAILLDRDHTIGHSYFMQLQNEDYNGLREVFVNKIIPLLQEYFYNDYEKIAMVLGEGFVEVATTKVAFAYKSSGDYGSESSITLKKSADIAIESAIQKLMNVKPSE